MVNKIITQNKELLNFLSPDNWAHKIKDKVFVFHGANDSMVPFTESYQLSNKLQNSELLISFVFELLLSSTIGSSFLSLLIIVDSFAFVSLIYS